MNSNKTFLFLFLCFFYSACESNESTPIPIATATAEVISQVSTLNATPLATATIPTSYSELEGAVLLDGFSITKFAHVYRPTAFAFDEEGNLFVASVDSNIYILKDEDNDNRVESQTIFESGFYLPLGLAFQPNTQKLYVSYQGAIKILEDTDQDNKADTSQEFVEGLPSTGLHQNNNLRFGSDGWLYMGLGSTCDACSEIDVRNASILRFNLDTGQSEIYATGLRNPFDLAFHPITGDLFATDNGRDDLGLEAPQEELNLILQNKNYGFPNCWDNQNTAGCENTIPAIAFFEPHSSADGLDFYTGNQFPEEYHNNAFVGVFGSWLNPDVITGIKQVTLIFKDGQYTSESSWFVQFPKGVMPLPIRFGPDGALYIGDYLNDTIYRISYGIN